MILTLDKYNKEFSDNYGLFENYIKTVSGRNYGHNCDECNELLHEVYETIRKRVVVSAITAQTVVQYIKYSLRSAVYQHLRPNKKENKIFVENVYDYYRGKEAEEILRQLDNFEKQSIDYRERSMFISKFLFKFLENRFSDKELFIFRSYYLMKNRMTYKRLSSQTGYSIGMCSEVIKKIKKDVRENFNDWYVVQLFLLNKLEKMNDETLIKIVESGITSIPHNKLMTLYKYVTGEELSTNCSGCAKRKAINTILKYYRKIKTN